MQFYVKFHLNDSNFKIADNSYITYQQRNSNLKKNNCKLKIMECNITLNNDPEPLNFSRTAVLVTCNIISSVNIFVKNPWKIVPAIIYLFKLNIKNRSKRCEICSKLTKRRISTKIDSHMNSRTHKHTQTLYSNIHTH